MNKKVQILITGIVILLGASLLCYGAFFHSRVIFIPDKENKSIESMEREPALIKLASISGIKRDESGKIKQLFGEGEAPPKKCAT
jgi:hypothetical protein